MLKCCEGFETHLELAAMSNLSALEDSSVVRDLSSENEILRLQCKEQSDRLEALNQEVHTLRKRLEVAEKIQGECLSEVESLQEQLGKTSASNLTLVSKLKEEHGKASEEYEYKIQLLEYELQELRRKNVGEQEELKKVRRELDDVQTEETIKNLRAELQELLGELAANRMSCLQHQELNKILSEEKAHILDELNSIKEHLGMREEMLRICKSDLIKQSETLEDVRESYAVAQNELACLKAGPSDSKSRGNSLFAEVEDKRQDMLKKVSVLSKKYSEMKRDYSSKCAEISKLKLENLQLRRRWQEEEEEQDKRDIWLKDNYDIRIKELSKMVEDLKKEEKAVFISGDSTILTYAEKIVEESRKKLEQLREEMEWRSSERLNEAKALYLARCEIQTLKSELMSAQTEKLVLQDKLEKANIPGKPSDVEVCAQSEIGFNFKTALSASERKLNQAKDLTMDLQSLSLNMEGCDGSLPINPASDSSVNDVKTSEITESVGTGCAQPLQEIFKVEGHQMECDLTEENIQKASNSKTSHPMASNLDSCDDGTMSSFPDTSLVPGRCLLNTNVDNPSQFSLGGENINPQKGVNDFSSLASEMAMVNSHHSFQDKELQDICEQEDEATGIESDTLSSDTVAHGIKKTIYSIKVEQKQESENVRNKSFPCSVDQLDGLSDNAENSSECAEEEDSAATEKQFEESIELLKAVSSEENDMHGLIHPEFVYPSVSKPMKVIKAEMKENCQFEGQDSQYFKDKLEIARVDSNLQGSSGVACDSSRSKEEPLNVRSILSKSARQYLVPLDQNMKSRKVCFADSEVKDVTEIDAPKKKLKKVPQAKTYKTRFIVSKDDDD